MQTKNGMRRWAPVLIFLGLVAGFLVVGWLLRSARPERPLREHSVRRPPERAAEQFPRYDETWTYGQGSVKVVHLQLDGFIGRQRPAGLLRLPEDMTTSLLRQIRAAKNDTAVRGLLLEVNSGGGALTPCDEIYHALLGFRESMPGRAIVVYARDIAASGAYLIAMAGDQVVSSPTALIGSIGVMLQTLNWNELSERIGVHDLTIKSGRNKDQLNPFRAVSSEERDLLQEMVDEQYERFLAIVARGRSLDAEVLRPYADGRIMTAARALDAGLIDHIGHWDEALQCLAQLLDEEDLRVVRYEKSVSLWSLLMRARWPQPPVLWSPPSGPRLLSVWNP